MILRGLAIKSLLFIVFLFLLLECKKEVRNNGTQKTNPALGASSSKTENRFKASTKRVQNKGKVVIKSLIFNSTLADVLELFKPDMTELEKIKKVYQYVHSILVYQTAKKMDKYKKLPFSTANKKFLDDYFKPENYCKSITKSEILQFYNEIKWRYVHPDYFDIIKITGSCCHNKKAKECASCMNRLPEIKNALRDFIGSEPHDDISKFIKKLKDEFKKKFDIHVESKEFKFFYTSENKKKMRYIPQEIFLDISTIITTPEEAFSNIFDTIDGFKIYFTKRWIKKAKLTPDSPKIYEDVKRIYCFHLIDEGKIKFYEDLRHDYGVKIDWKSLNLSPEKYSPYEKWIF